VTLVRSERIHDVVRNNYSHDYITTCTVQSCRTSHVQVHRARAECFTHSQSMTGMPLHMPTLVPICLSHLVVVSCLREACSLHHNRLLPLSHLVVASCLREAPSPHHSRPCPLAIRSLAMATLMCLRASLACCRCSAIAATTGIDASHALLRHLAMPRRRVSPLAPLATKAKASQYLDHARGWQPLPAPASIYADRRATETGLGRSAVGVLRCLRTTAHSQRGGSGDGRDNDGDSRIFFPGEDGSGDGLQDFDNVSQLIEELSREGVFATDKVRYAGRCCCCRHS